ncbi:MAG: bifunctional DNA-formamidopyrimidine glycosylase/DNA-(apurinic or apyrimidinic site) lyase [Rickettsiales bacterium]
MPELPEVETILCGLTPYIDGAEIKSIILNRGNLRIPIPEELSLLKNARIVNYARRGKYIILSLDNEKSIIIHLGMSGKLLLSKDNNYVPRKHDHVQFILNKEVQFVLNDPRRFGLVTYTATSELESHKLLSHLGVEPLTENFSAEYLANACKNKSKPIKNLIMDNSIVVGVGNIYACESLFKAKVSPFRPAMQLGSTEIDTLTSTIKEVLLEAIKAGGSTLKDYAQLDGVSGYFQHQFSVYNQEKCKICDSDILKKSQAGRSTFFCANCQTE